MSLTYPIPRGTRAVDLVAAAGQTVFGPIDFRLYDAMDVGVWLTPPEGLRARLDHSAYTVSPVVPAIAFPAVFTITLATPAAEGTRVEIMGARIPERSTDVTRNGVLQSQRLEAELDKVTVVAQELRRDYNQGFVEHPSWAPVIAAVTDGERRVLLVTDWVGGGGDKPPVNVFLSASGYTTNIAAATNFRGSAGPQGLAGDLVSFASRAAAQAVSVPVDVQYLRTAGYTAPGDGGNGLYKRVVSEPAHAAKFQTLGGAWWELAETVWNVKQFGAVLGAAGDATAAFQAAANTGRVIDVPEGVYRIDGQVKCIYGTHFRGTSHSGTIRPVGTGIGPSLLGPGSIILVPNAVVTPFLYYSGNIFEGLTFHYPNQLSSATTPTPYPATFARVPDNPAEVAVANVWRNLQFVNAYIWIDALPGHLEYVFQDLTGCAIYRGIMSDGCGGTDIFKQIRISSYYWGYGTAVTPWILANAQGLALGRIDHFFADDIYLSDMNVGVRLFKGAVNTPTGVYGRFCNIGFEGCNYSFYVECTNSQGVVISNASLCARLGEFQIPGGNADPVHLMLDGVYSWGPRTSFLSCNKVARITLNGVTIDDPADIAFGPATTSSDLFMTAVDFSGGGTLRTQAQFNRMALTGNGFGAAPTLNAPPASSRRFSGNLGLADA